MICDDSQIFDNFIPVLLINVEKTIVRDDNKVGVEWSYLLEDNSLEQEINIAGCL